VSLRLAGARSSENIMGEIKLARVNENERKVLAALAEWYSDEAEWNAFYLRGLVSETKLELSQVRRSVCSLAKKGLAKYERGLFNEDGEVAGSGYRATLAGAALLNPCDVCGDLASFVYDGKRECEQHYGKNTKTDAVQTSILELVK
jgi:hypothetical protein